MQGYVDTSRAERAVWLMKCLAVISRSLYHNRNHNLPVAKVVVSIDPLRSDDNDSTQERRKQPVKASEMKRTRRDRGEMGDIMFKLFEEQPNRTLKELIHKTDQHEQFMKDLLKDLCVYGKKGANQGIYELKPE